jgi:PAS domain S-box-containing protein
VAITLLLRWPLWPILGGQLPLLFLWPAVVFCAWLGGLWPGLLATVLSALAGGILFWFAQDSVNITAPAVWVGLLAFVGLGGLTSLALERLHEARRELQEERRKLTTERDWLRAILTSIADAVIVTDADEFVKLMSPVACTLTGWSRDLAIGQHVNKVFHIISEKTRQTIEQPVARVLREGKTAAPGGQAILVSRDGLEKRIDEWIAPLRDGDGHIAGAVVSFQEASHRRPAGRESPPGLAPGPARVYEPAALAQIPAEAQLSAIRLRVMVVEDNHESAEALATFLQLQGHEVIIAFSGQEALKRAPEWQPQMVFCDIGLPGMDGNSVAIALRKNPATAKARLIALSGTGSDEIRQRAIQAGFDHLLTKPVDPQVFQTVVALQTLVGNNEILTGRGKNSA